jgi:hypothetical protein
LILQDEAFDDPHARVTPLPFVIVVFELPFTVILAVGCGGGVTVSVVWLEALPPDPVQVIV